jgi:hypothetical protein
MATKSKGDPSLRSYLELILASSITVWWAVATGVIEMLGFGLVSDTIVLSKWWFLLAVLVVSFSLLMGFLVLYKAWPLYSKTYDRITISQIVRVDDEQVFLLEGLHGFKIGSMFEVYRKTKGVEISIGFIQVTHQREDGIIQAKPVWIVPGHLRDIETGGLSVQNLTVCQTVSRDTVSKWVKDKAEIEVQDLIRRGTGI